MDAGACGFMGRSLAAPRQGWMPRLKPPLPRSLEVAYGIVWRVKATQSLGTQVFCKTQTLQLHYSSLISRRNVQKPETSSTSAASTLHMHTAKPLYHLRCLSFFPSTLFSLRQNTFDGSDPADKALLSVTITAELVGLLFHDDLKAILPSSANRVNLGRVYDPSNRQDLDCFIFMLIFVEGQRLGTKHTPQQLPAAAGSGRTMQ